LPPQYFSWDGTLGRGTIFAWIIGNTGAIFSTQYVIQAVAATKGPSEARNSTLYAAAFCIPIAFMAAFVGVAAKHLYPKLNALYAFPVFIQSMNPFWGGLVTTAIVASVFANVATVALAITSLLIKDFYFPYYNPSPERQLQITRYASVIVGFLPLPFVLLVQALLKMQFFTRGLRTAIAIVALTGFYLPMFSSGTGATLALVLSTLATSAWFFSGNPYGIDNIYIAVVTPLLVMGIDHLVNRKRRAEPKRIPVPQRDN
jgi:solute:Na+ symporter, SSS family